MAENQVNMLYDFVKDRIGNNLLDHQVDRDSVDIFTIKRDCLLGLLKNLRDEGKTEFKHLSWLTAIDYPDSTIRFIVVYELRNLQDFTRIRLKVPVSEKDPWVPTVVGIYPTADWHEREMMELFGIEVRGHPDPRKLLLPDWVNEYPLRKEFPSGGEELWEFHKKVITMFNNKSEYQGDLTDPWLERFNT